MKNNMKDSKGITLITLVITIIVLAILSSVAVYNGVEVINSSKLTRFTAEMKLIQTRVNEIYDNRSKYLVTGEEASGHNTEFNTAKNSVGSNFSTWGYSANINDYRYFTGSKLQENLEVEDVEQSVFIDFNNRKVISAKGITVDGQSYYVLEQLPNSVYNVDYEKNSQLPLNFVDKNVKVKEQYNNQIVIPKGFKVRIDDTTNNADTVDKGIVIEDQKGNQFVWVPVGTFNTNKEGTTTQTIDLERYSFASDGTPSNYSESYTEDTQVNHNSSYGNAIAKDIEKFINSANSNNGYYVGRYEAGVVNGALDTSLMVNSYTAPNSNWTGYVAQEGKQLELVCKTGQQVWNYVTQNKASELARGMYTGKSYESDLTNCYAWDTAIVFIQKCSGDTDYSRQTRLQSTLAKTGEATDGKNKDVRCNIYDMAGNDVEWSTETSRNASSPCVYRGGNYYSNSNFTSSHFCYGTNNAYSSVSFRPLLYL